MGKSVNVVSDMLNAGRRRTASSSRTEQLGDGATRRLVVETTSKANTRTSAEELGNQAPGPLVAESLTYQRSTVFLTPEQRRWLKDTARSLPADGLSASDIVRLALVRLRAAVDEGDLELLEALTEQAHEEAQRLAGRRNRGLPPRTETSVPR